MNEKDDEYGPTHPSLHHEPAADNTGQPPSSEVVEDKFPVVTSPERSPMLALGRASDHRSLACSPSRASSPPHRHPRNAALPSFPTTPYKPRSLADPADELSRNEPAGVSERMMSNLPSLGLEGGH